MLDSLFNSLCIELNSNYIKVVEGRKGKKAKILKAQYIKLKNLNSGVIDVLDENAIVEALNRFFFENKVSKKSVNIVLSGLTNLLVREVTIPYIQSDKIYTMLKYESSQYFPVNIDKYILDYKVLEVLKDGKNKKLRLLVFAVPKNIIDQVMSIVNKLNLKINRIDIEPNVLTRLSKRLEIGKEQSAMLLNVERNFLTAVIVKDGIVQLTKTYPHDLNIDDDGELISNEYSVNEVYDNITKLIEFYKIRERQELNNVFVTGELSKNIRLDEVLPKKVAVNVNYIINLDFIDTDCDKNKFIIPISTFI
ncbi:type IV pilus biogenesis protein PilM [Caloramator proteoclasticus]|uniref:Type IV pilus assembly protein PilM n=1 Tax=Caloramator proteoclasticus DSM 10124 TaxID=1121262 RepID=A0A1M4ZKR6_9CLOT|nr:pilus assembly protein PilM [Caloramator proteoclasticus]SHF18649.1 type IV pilus assembly protein PilM [Caloramator proteoclasticus DSM 10124]